MPRIASSIECQTDAGLVIGQPVARAHRYAVMLTGSIKLETSARDGMPIRVRDISASGLMGECGYPTRMGDRVAIDLPRIGRVMGRVRWGAMGRVGIQFDTPIDPTRAFGAPPRSGLVSAH